MEQSRTSSKALNHLNLQEAQIFHTCVSDSKTEVMCRKSRIVEVSDHVDSVGTSVLGQPYLLSISIYASFVYVFYSNKIKQPANIWRQSCRF